MFCAYLGLSNISSLYLDGVTEMILPQIDLIHLNIIFTLVPESIKYMERINPGTDANTLQFYRPGRFRFLPGFEIYIKELHLIFIATRSLEQDDLAIYFYRPGHRIHRCAIQFHPIRLLFMIGTNSIKVEHNQNRKNKFCFHVK